MGDTRKSLCVQSLSGAAARTGILKKKVEKEVQVEKQMGEL